ncbi:sensor histidine kinase [Puia dinghuensis]|uniref:Histidine kinase n=1 Tax=Puia dinghuensis TaxID=1792502 RepID=A0A8J2UGB1_9BACT|nr:histidine kinase [Puia dinghuensis]GGB13825.1 histidine kinase [Puia dinghuensis]
MTSNGSKYYWWCQIGGWGSLALVMVLNSSTLEQKITTKEVEIMTITVLTGILVTHIFREVIRRSGWALLTVDKALPKFLIGVTLTCITIGLIRMAIVDVLNLASHHNTEFMPRLLTVTVDTGLMIIPWTLIYYFYHYTQISARHELDTLKLEALVKELELKTIKSHINPHFIFNALNSIRALIDENPARARTAITELSNILRSSMQAEKLETVTFEKELNIVKDYLALEHIRFEDRLQVEYDIDEDTLDQPIPPMMLQTLVENAIKHGISRQVDGGKVTIVSDFKEDYHRLVILNTGVLNGSRNTDGFGLASTKNRLQLLFGQKANFNIREAGNNTVEARVLIPVHMSK